MGLDSANHGREDGSDDEEGRPELPEGVLRGIEDIDEGRTASKDDIESILNF
jgi:hypothetical protein